MQTQSLLKEWIQPAPLTATLRDPHYNVWCGSPIRGDDGRYHLYYSRWPRASMHAGWLTHSEIAHAVSEQPLGPYRHAGVALSRRGNSHWDGLSIFNPTILRVADRYVLYYTGTTGTESNQVPNWKCRNRQRIGVATADRPEGPWQRSDSPLIDVSADVSSPDALMVSNPSVCARPSGGFLMVYKAVGLRAPMPFGGPVVLLSATAEQETGPFCKQTIPMFTYPGENFAVEDPFVWYEANQYWMIVKDMRGRFTRAGCSLALCQSADGSEWEPATHPLVATLDLCWTDGRAERLTALERPQLLFEAGIPVALFCAAASRRDRDESFNVHLPLEVKNTGDSASVVAES